MLILTSETLGVIDTEIQEALGRLRDQPRSLPAAAPGRSYPFT